MSVGHHTEHYDDDDKFPAQFLGYAVRPPDHFRVFLLCMSPNNAVTSGGHCIAVLYLVLPYRLDAEIVESSFY